MHILNVEDTLDLLFENPKSFCRYGDGEIKLINGRGLDFQDYDKNLSDRLREILQSRDDKCYVGLDHRYFYPENIPESNKNFMRERGPEIRSTLLRYCNRKKLYIAATYSCFYLNHLRTPYQYQIHFNIIKELFRNRKLVIFSGRTVFDKINYNVFEYAAEKVHVSTESKNAWSHYDEIMNAARKYPKDVTLCFILGPTATVIAYDLAQEGYTAWDIGHIAKDYDAFKKGLEHTLEKHDNFFAPD